MADSLWDIGQLNMAGRRVNAARGKGTPLDMPAGAGRQDREQRPQGRSLRDITRDGGTVDGPGTPTSDDVGPVMLSRREVVVPSDTADAIGRDKLEAIRRATHTPVDGSPRGLADGIIDPDRVPVPAPQAVAQAVPTAQAPTVVAQPPVQTGHVGNLANVGWDPGSGGPTWGGTASPSPAPTYAAPTPKRQPLIAALASRVSSDTSPWGSVTKPPGFVNGYPGEDATDAYTKAIQKVTLPVATPPGGSYLQDQFQQAGKEYDAGNYGKAAGVAARGMVTAPVVAVGESFRRVGQDIGQMGRAAAPFLSGLTGIGDNGAQAAPRPPAVPTLGGIPVQTPPTPAQSGIPGTADSQATRVYGDARGRGNLPNVPGSPDEFGPPETSSFGPNDAPGNQFRFRDLVRGGAAPGTAQGIGGRPGQTLTKDYGFGGPAVVATADKDGRYNTFTQAPAAPGASPSPASIGGGMTTEQANEFYGAKNAALRANDLHNLVASDQRNLASAQAQTDRIAADNATWAARVDAGRGAAKSAISAGAAADARARANSSQNTLASIAPPDYAGQAAAVQNAGRGVQQAQIARDQSDIAKAESLRTLAQHAVLDPLQAQEARQNLAKGSNELQLSNMNVAHQQHITDLQKRALGSGADAHAANDMLALYQKAASGKGGPITDEDILKTHGDMTNRAIQMGGPSAIKDLPSFREYKQSLLGSGSTPPPEAILHLRKNPQMAALFEAKYGLAKGESAQYLKGN